MFDQQACRIAAGGHAQTLARRIGVGLDRALADIEQARHFLGLQVFRDQAQDFLLALRQGRDPDLNIPHCRAPVSHTQVGTLPHPEPCGQDVSRLKRVNQGFAQLKRDDDAAENTVS